MVATATRPVAKQEAKIAFVISRKAAAWADENGYSNLLIDLADFLVKYREANPATSSYYDGMKPEQLMNMIAATRRRLDRQMAALSGKTS